MSPHILSRVPILGKFVDERFLDYRRRSSSAAGIVAALVAVGLFEYRYFHDHFISWDLLAVAVSMVIVKMSMMVWFRANG
jgi:hypothetical protein